MINSGLSWPRLPAAGIGRIRDNHGQLAFRSNGQISSKGAWSLHCGNAWRKGVLKPPHLATYPDVLALEYAPSGVAALRVSSVSVMALHTGGKFPFYSYYPIF